MEVLLKIPKEFEEHFNNDRFKDSLKRIHITIERCNYLLIGKYELELIEMLENAMVEAVVIARLSNE